MEFEEAKKIFIDEFKSLEPCCELKDGILVGMEDRGIEVHLSTDAFSDFEMMSRKRGLEGINFLKSVKLPNATPEIVKSMAKEAVDLCRKIMTAGKTVDDEKEG